MKNPRACRHCGSPAKGPLTCWYKRKHVRGEVASCVADAAEARRKARERHDILALGIIAIVAIALIYSLIGPMP